MSGFGGSVGSFNCGTGYAKTIIRNNLVYHSLWNATYDQSYLSVCGGSYVTADHNTFIKTGSSPYWKYNTDVGWSRTGEDAQFTSLPDSATTRLLLASPRKADGSLPDITAFHLAPGSDLIDAGIDTGLPYYGSSPDLGAFEYSEVPQASNEYPTVGITSPSQGSTLTSQNVIVSIQASDPDGSISRVELFYNDHIEIGDAQVSKGLWSYSWDNAPVGILSLRAVAFDNQGAQTISSSVDITIQKNIITADNSGENIDNFIVLYPNPNNGLFTFYPKTPLESSCEIAIISFEGKIVYNDIMLSGETEKRLNLSNLRAGFYILQLTNNNDKMILLTSKFIKH